MHWSELRTKPGAHLVSYAHKLWGVELQKETERSQLLRQIVKQHLDKGPELDGIPDEIRHELGYPVAVLEGDSARYPFPGGKPGTELRVELTIHPAENQPEYVPVSHNGRAILIKREERVQIPYQHFLVLQDAVITETYLGADEKEHSRDIPRFNYTVHRELDVPYAKAS